MIDHCIEGLDWSICDNSLLMVLFFFLVYFLFAFSALDMYISPLVGIEPDSVNRYLLSYSIVFCLTCHTKFKFQKCNSHKTKQQKIQGQGREKAQGCVN